MPPAGTSDDTPGVPVGLYNKYSVISSGVAFLCERCRVAVASPLEHERARHNEEHITEAELNELRKCGCDDGNERCPELIARIDELERQLAEARVDFNDAYAEGRADEKAWSR